MSSKEPSNRLLLFLSVVCVILIGAAIYSTYILFTTDNAFSGIVIHKGTVVNVEHGQVSFMQTGIKNVTIVYFADNSIYILRDRNDMVPIIIENNYTIISRMNELLIENTKE